MKSLLCMPFALLMLSGLNAGAAPKAETPDKDADYIRFVEEGAKAKLQTAVVHYTHPDGATMDVIGVVHIGDKTYYEKLNKDFEAYDALLYEMVGKEPDEPLTKEKLRGEKKNPMRFFQLMIAGMMQLDFQLDNIDYTAKNFVHADMDFETFRKLQKERGEDLLKLMEKSLKAQQEAQKQGKKSFDMAEMFRLLSSESGPNAMKLALGRQFHDIESMIAGMEGSDGSVLVAERNRVALEVMDREIKAGKKKLALFYGAAHLDDFDKRLREKYGFKRGKTTWNTAWDINKAKATEKAPEDSDKSPKESKKAA